MPHRHLMLMLVPWLANGTNIALNVTEDLYGD